MGQVVKIWQNGTLSPREGQNIIGRNGSTENADESYISYSSVCRQSNRNTKISIGDGGELAEAGEMGSRDSGGETSASFQLISSSGKCAGGLC